MYTVKKIMRIFNEAKSYYDIKHFKSLEYFLRDCGLSSEEWHIIINETNEYIRKNKISRRHFDEYFQQRYIQALSNRGKIVDGKTCIP
jgi:hypothetical protein